MRFAQPGRKDSCGFAGDGGARGQEREDRDEALSLSGCSRTKAGSGGVNGTSVNPCSSRPPCTLPPSAPNDGFSYAPASCGVGFEINAFGTEIVGRFNFDVGAVGISDSVRHPNHSTEETVDDHTAGCERWCTSAEKNSIKKYASTGGSWLVVTLYHRSNSVLIILDDHDTATSTVVDAHTAIQSAKGKLCIVNPGRECWLTLRSTVRDRSIDSNIDGRRCRQARHNSDRSFDVGRPEQPTELHDTQYRRPPNLKVHLARLRA